MRYGIVGSRRRTDEASIRAFVRELPEGSTVVSGGAKGPDSWATSEARKCGLEVVEHLPDLRGTRNRIEATERYYARNRLIAQESDVVVAFVAPDRRGGTENTIRHAKELGVPVWLR